MASLIEIYQEAATTGNSLFPSGLTLYNGPFNNGIDGTQVAGVGGIGIGYTNLTSNVYKPTNPSYENASIVGNIPYSGNETYSANSIMSPPAAGPYQGHY